MNEEKKKQQMDVIKILMQLNEKGLTYAQCVVNTAFAVQQAEEKKTA